MPFVGDTLHLNLQLFDGATDKFVRANLFDDAGAPLSPASVNLSHVGFGLYSSDAVPMPNTAQVRAVYRVFSDSGYTVPSTLHANALDVFEREEAIDIGMSVPTDLQGTVELDPPLNGTTEPLPELEGIIETDDEIVED